MCVHVCVLCVCERNANASSKYSLVEENVFLHQLASFNRREENEWLQREAEQTKQETVSFNKYYGHMARK